MLIETLSTFPDMYASVMGTSMMRIAQEKGILQFAAYDLRDWTHDRHRTTDDDPYGGGAGLVMKCEPLFEAYEAICAGDVPLSVAASDSVDVRAFRAAGASDRRSRSDSPELARTAQRGCSARAELALCAYPRPLPPSEENMSADQLMQGAGSLDMPTKRVPHDAKAPVGPSPKQDCLSDWACPRSQPPDESVSASDGQEPSAARPYTIFLAPQGERFDDALACELAQQERLLFVCGHYEGIDERAYTLADRVISLGDYVLTSGELASMVVIDAVVRKLPGVLGAEEGAQTESFADGLLEYPQYTRPANFRGMEVPAVLLSGDHGAVAAWRRRQSLLRTARLRPDLLARVELSPADTDFLQSLGGSEES